MADDKDREMLEGHRAILRKAGVPLREDLRPDWRAEIWYMLGLFLVGMCLGFAAFGLMYVLHVGGW